MIEGRCHILKRKWIVHFHHLCFLNPLTVCIKNCKEILIRLKREFFHMLRIKFFYGIWYVITLTVCPQPEKVQSQHTLLKVIDRKICENRKRCELFSIYLLVFYYYMSSYLMKLYKKNWWCHLQNNKRIQSMIMMVFIVIYYYVIKYKKKNFMLLKKEKVWHNLT